MATVTTEAQVAGLLQNKREELLALCKEYKLKNYSNLNKEKLAKKLVACTQFVKDRQSTQPPSSSTANNADESNSNNRRRRHRSSGQTGDRDRNHNSNHQEPEEVGRHGEDDEEQHGGSDEAQHGGELSEQHSGGDEEQVQVQVQVQNQAAAVSLTTPWFHVDVSLQDAEWYPEQQFRRKLHAGGDYLETITAALKKQLGLDGDEYSDIYTTVRPVAEPYKPITMASLTDKSDVKVYKWIRNQFENTYDRIFTLINQINGSALIALHDTEASVNGKARKCNTVFFGGFGDLFFNCQSPFILSRHTLQ